MEREIDGITIKEENGVVTYVGGTPSTLEIVEHDGYISYTGDDSGEDSNGLELVAETTLENVQSSSTTETKIATLNVKDIEVGNTLLVDVKSKAGLEANKYYGEKEIMFINSENTEIMDNRSAIVTIQGDALAKLKVYSSATLYGIYAKRIAKKPNMNIEIYVKYNSAYTNTIDGNFDIKIYKLPV